jgi:hypothetical protein
MNMNPTSEQGPKTRWWLALTGLVFAPPLLSALWFWLLGLLEGVLTHPVVGDEFILLASTLACGIFFMWHLPMRWSVKIVLLAIYTPAMAVATLGLTLTFTCMFTGNCL